MHLGRRGNGNGKASQRRLVPAARSTDLVVEELGDELLIYDTVSNRAHCLSATAARVWRACDGQSQLDVVGTRLDLGADSLSGALEELQRCSLLEDTPHVHVGSRMTRREVAFKTAKYGTAVAAVPLIWSVAGPVPEAAATPTPAQCNQYTDKDCDGCRKVCGCCCCCQPGDCKLCYPTNLCPSFNCPRGVKEGDCSATQAADCVEPGTSIPCKPPNAAQVTRPCCTF